MKRPHEGRVAVVTGAGRGIGQAIALKLAENGARVALVDMTDPSETAQLIGHAAISIVADVTCPEEWERIGTLTDAIGGADIVVNNAGIYPYVPFEELTLELWRQTFAVNIEAHFHSAKTFAPRMRRKRWGRFINVGSNSVGVNTLGLSHYIASKMAVIGFVRGLANDLAADGITINAILPSPTTTPGTLANPGTVDAFQRFAQLQAIKRVGEAADMAGPVSFLASDDAAFMTGQGLVVDGGFYKVS